MQAPATQSKATPGEWLHVDELRPWDRNPRKNDPAVPGVAASIRRFGFVAPIVVWRGGNRMVAGHTRLKAMRSILEEDPDFVAPGAPGPGMVRVIFHEFDSEVLADAYAIADNKLGETAEWDTSLLFASLRRVHDEDDKLLQDIGFTEAESVSFLSGIGEAEAEDVNGTAPDAVVEKAKRSLAERFGVPPFSILDARQGYWQERKRAWLALGIKSEIGRGENLLGMSLQSLLSQALGGDYDAAVAAIADARARGLTDAQIRLEALTQARTPEATALLAEQVPGFQEKLAAGLSEAQIVQDWITNPKARETASLKTGLAYGMTMHPYDGLQSQAGSGGTSIFDPVLCELACRWFSPPGGMVLDPFAGGSVRGIVAAALGRRYRGFELRAEQVAANREQFEELRARIGADEGLATWTEGDSGETIQATPEEPWADLVFSCPPYADLEVYSDDPKDLSTLGYVDFRVAYRKIIADACSRLKNDRFAAFVVGEVRDKAGRVNGYLGFVQDTIAAFEDAGLTYYNEAILITATGSLALRASRMFTATRKLGKSHQNVLVFVKGDPRKAVAAIGDIEFGEDEPAPGSDRSAGVELMTLDGSAPLA